MRLINIKLVKGSKYQVCHMEIGVTACGCSYRVFNSPETRGESRKPVHGIPGYIGNDASLQGNSRLSRMPLDLPGYRAWRSQ